MRLGLRGGVWNRMRTRALVARLALALTGAAVLVAAALAGPLPSWLSLPGASPLSAQEPEGSAETDRAALMAIYEALNGPEWVDTRWGDEAVGLARTGRPMSPSAPGLASPRTRTDASRAWSSPAASGISRGHCRPSWVTSASCRP